MTLYESKRWPNYCTSLNPVKPDREWGIFHQYTNPFSAKEIERRHDLVRAKLKEMDCDMLIVQGWFPTGAMAAHASLTWLIGENGLRNTHTLILPKDGELIHVAGVKTCNLEGSKDPYTTLYDMSKYIKGAKRIAYDRTGLMTHEFYNYLQEVAPGVEIVDFSNELEYMKACKSEEEIWCLEESIYVQEKIYQAAATFIYPGRTMWEMQEDIVRLMHLWGTDATIVNKILIMIGKNRSAEEGGAAEKWMFNLPPTYRLEDDDYVDLTLETPGAGGYYTIDSRTFLFSKPHPDVQEIWDDAVACVNYTQSLLKPGMTGEELHEKMNAFKVSRGLDPWIITDEVSRGHMAHGCALPELNGIGINTVDRPQFLSLYGADWDDMKMDVGQCFNTYKAGEVSKGKKKHHLHRNFIITEDGCRMLGDFPMELIVL